MTASIQRCYIQWPRRISYLQTFSKTGGNTTQYPELATAAINGPEAVGDKLRYEFVRAVGTKG
jgi:hypothetical protein